MSFKNKEDFLEHTEQHIENVKELSKVTFRLMLKDQQLRKKYGINTNKQAQQFEQKLLSVISDHDGAKISKDNEFLKSNNLEKPLYEILFESVGKELTGEDRKVINKLNKLDSVITNISLAENNCNYIERQLYFFVEHMADIVERGCNPLSKFEFGREVSKASDYRPEERDENELALLKKVETYYDRKIKPRQVIFGEELGVLKKENNSVKNDDEILFDVIKMIQRKKEGLAISNKNCQPIIKKQSQEIRRSITRH